MRTFATREEQDAFRVGQAANEKRIRKNAHKKALDELIALGYCGDLETVRLALDSPFCPAAVASAQ